MNNGNILVNEQVLKDTAASYRNSIARMGDLLETATANINKTSQTWTGGAAEGLRLKYDKFKAVFEPFKMSVEEFAKFLDTAAEEFRITESTVQKAAEESISDVNING